MRARHGRWLPAQDALPAALALSLALHLVVVLGLRAGALPSRVAGPQSMPLAARLAPEPAQQGGMLATSAAADLAMPAGSTPPPGQVHGDTTSSASRGEVPLQPALQRQYYLASRVHKAPTLLRRAEFTFPEGVNLREGVVVARVLIGETGKVDGVVIDLSQPAGAFDGAAMAALLQWQFTPGILHGAPVPTQIAVEVRFSASDTLPPMFAVLGR